MNYSEHMCHIVLISTVLKVTVVATNVGFSCRMTRSEYLADIVMSNGNLHIIYIYIMNYAAHMYIYVLNSTNMSKCAGSVSESLTAPNSDVLCPSSYIIR